MEQKTTIWTTVFWIMTALAVLHYLFFVLSKIQDNPNADGAYILGSLIPNALIVLIFWLIKRKSEK